VLAALLGVRLALVWPALVALLPFVVGLAAYPAVLARFDFGQLRTGAGDQWVSGGALAITTLATALIAKATASSHELAALHGALRIAAVVLWALTIAWLPVLIGSEVRWRRHGYDVRRWATVFPLGMYSAMSYATGTIAGVDALVEFADTWARVALAAWIATVVGLTRRLIDRRELVRRD
jgi:tellurite resistance protein TehA-like permease